MRHFKQTINDNYNADISLIDKQFNYKIDENMFLLMFKNR